MSLSSAASSASASAFASASVASSGFLRLSTPSSASLLTFPRLRLKARLPFGLIASSGRAFSCRGTVVAVIVVAVVTLLHLLTDDELTSLVG